MEQKKTSAIAHSVIRAPIIAVLGHVDHGKTTLLDTIRNTSVAAREIGGITQRIGAYQTQFKGKTLTFIDTPGHEAFIKMRTRGADVADIAVLVVAANDGVKPQTLESIKIIQAAKIPFVVALNKIDVPGINPEKIKKQLTQAGINLEEYGGETPIVPISALKNDGIDKLLDMIQLLAELHPVTSEEDASLKAIVIESLLSKQRGAVATVILRSGTIRVGQEVQQEEQIFKIRAILDWQGAQRSTASAGDPVQILGWQKVPPVGSVLVQKGSVSAKKPSTGTPAGPTSPVFSALHPLQEEKVKLILKADTLGSLEAITEGLKQNDSLLIINASVGIMSESDILLAKTTGSIVLGFNVEPVESVKRLAQSEKVLIKTYTIIYELFDEINDVVEAIKQGNMVTILGEAKILAFFPYEGEQVAGVKVMSGRIARGDQVKLMRGEEEIGRTRIKSVRHKKESITKAEEGTEAGILLAQSFDLLTGDSIIAIG